MNAIEILGGACIEGVIIDIGSSPSSRAKPGVTTDREIEDDARDLFEALYNNLEARIMNLMVAHFLESGAGQRATEGMDDEEVRDLIDSLRNRPVAGVPGLVEV